MNKLEKKKLNMMIRRLSESKILERSGQSQIRDQEQDTESPAIPQALKRSREEEESFEEEELENEDK